VAPVALGIVLATVVLVAVVGGAYRLSAREAGPAQGAETVELRVTRDYGTTSLVSRRAAVSASSTVLPMLSANAEVETAYGGGFVDSIDGVTSGQGGAGEGRADWFYYVNGLQATMGAADYRLTADDRVWWDFHAWEFAPAVPAVVGHYPEPFRSGAAAQPLPTEIAYSPTFADDADRLAESLRSAGVTQVRVAEIDAGALPPSTNHVILLGTWDDLLGLPWVREAAENPAGSGIFARSESGALVALDTRGRATGRATQAGAILATARADAPEAAIWLVTGGAAADVSAATALLVTRPKELAGRFGVLVERNGAVTPLPIGASR
jgi:hypothetical protein